MEFPINISSLTGHEEIHLQSKLFFHDAVRHQILVARVRTTDTVSPVKDGIIASGHYQVCDIGNYSKKRLLWIHIKCLF
jgi:hypothetical protein